MTRHSLNIPIVNVSDLKFVLTVVPYHGQDLSAVPLLVLIMTGTVVTWLGIHQLFGRPACLQQKRRNTGLEGISWSQTQATHFVCLLKLIHDGNY